MRGCSNQQHCCQGGEEVKVKELLRKALEDWDDIWLCIPVNDIYYCVSGRAEYPDIVLSRAS